MAIEQPLLTFQRQVHWRNKHLNVECQVERLYDVWNRWADGSLPSDSRVRLCAAALSCTGAWRAVAFW